jgi:hypothetical protein
MLLARNNKFLHEAARLHFTSRSDAGLITVVVMSSAGGLISILLGATGDGAVLNASQIALGCVSAVSAAIMSLSKQLGWETRAHKHAEYAGYYSELARLISSERVLAGLDDSSYANVGELIKKVWTELNRIEDNDAPPIPSFIIEKRLNKKPLRAGALPGFVGRNAAQDGLKTN